MAIAINPTRPLSGKQAEKVLENLRNNPKKGKDKLQFKVKQKLVKKIREISD